MVIVVVLMLVQIAFPARAEVIGRDVFGTFSDTDSRCHPGSGTIDIQYTFRYGLTPPEDYLNYYHLGTNSIEPRGPDIFPSGGVWSNYLNSNTYNLTSNNDYWEEATFYRGPTLLGAAKLVYDCTGKADGEAAVVTITNFMLAGPGGGDGGGEEPILKTQFTDGRINPDPAATMVGYCQPDHSIVVYSPKGALLFTASAKTIKAALASAVSTKRHVLIKQAAGQQLWALSSNQLQFHDALGIDYNYRFSATFC
jgi:hypothetical protein